MRNIWLVIKHEIADTLGKKSFWFMTFVFPLLILGLNLGTGAMAENVAKSEREAAASEAVGGRAVGYVDESGLIARWPDGMEGAFVPFPDQASAQAALKAGQLKQYYLLPADFMQTGEVVLVGREFTPLRSLEGTEAFQYLISFNLAQDKDLAAALLDPTWSVIPHALSPVKPRQEGMLGFWLPFVTMFIFFFSLTMSSGFMLQSVSKEKESRVVEVLLLSLRPRELMLGKVLGLGAVALFQMVVWMGGGLLVLDRGRGLVQGLASVTLPPGFVLWGLLYFVLGYLLYASAMAAIGALAPTAREGGQFTFMVLLPLMIPLWLNATFTESSNGGLATFLSLFPLTSPTSMMTRLVMAQVPAWQPPLGLLALAATAYLFVLLSARLFRADTLLSGLALNWRRLVQELRHRE